MQCQAINTFNQIIDHLKNANVPITYDLLHCFDSALSWKIVSGLPELLFPHRFQKDVILCTLVRCIAPS